MKNKKIKLDDSKKNLKKNRETVVDTVTTSYEQTVERGKEFGKESLDKLTQATHDATDFIKSKEYLQTLKDNSSKIKEKGLEQKIIFKKQSPKFYKKISSGFFYFFELLVGRIKMGTQYGAASLEILEKLAKLKELGIITEKEFTDKKKKILDRI